MAPPRGLSRCPAGLRSRCTDGHALSSGDERLFITDGAAREGRWGTYAIYRAVIPRRLLRQIHRRQGHRPFIVVLALSWSGLLGKHAQILLFAASLPLTYAALRHHHGLLSARDRPSAFINDLIAPRRSPHRVPLRFIIFTRGLHRAFHKPATIWPPRMKRCRDRKARGHHRNSRRRTRSSSH